jgi:hypothetical protein
MPPMVLLAVISGLGWGIWSLTLDAGIHTYYDYSGYITNGWVVSPQNPVGSANCPVVATDGKTCLKQVTQGMPQVTCRAWQVMAVSRGLGGLPLPTCTFAQDQPHTYNFAGMLPSGLAVPSGQLSAACPYLAKNGVTCLSKQTITNLTQARCQEIYTNAMQLGHWGTVGMIYPTCAQQ